jgi:hypothetical protein
MEPQVLIERLLALVPRPRKHLVTKGVRLDVQLRAGN